MGLHSNKILLTAAMFLLLIGSSCSQAGVKPTVTTQPGITTTPVLPTATSAPLALKVNGEGYLLVDYNEEMKRYQTAMKELGKDLTPEDQKKQVLDELTAQILFSQEAAKNGFLVNDDDIQKRMDDLAKKMGGQIELKKWMDLNGYNDESFQSALKRSLAVTWERDKILAGLPQAGEEIRARQILLHTPEGAEKVMQQLKTGTDFTTLAYLYDPQTGGDLGWFPRGFLLQPEVEASAFALQPGQVSTPVKSSIGYHILLVVAREQNRPFGPEAKRVLGQAALDVWLKQELAKSQVEIQLP